MADSGRVARNSGNISRTEIKERLARAFTKAAPQYRNPAKEVAVNIDASTDTVESLRQGNIPNAWAGMVQVMRAYPAVRRRSAPPRPDRERPRPACVGDVPGDAAGNHREGQMTATIAVCLLAVVALNIAVFLLASRRPARRHRAIQRSRNVVELRRGSLVDLRS
jgi:hypothetical protein